MCNSCACVCHSFSMGAGPTILKSDWSRAGLRMHLLVFVYIPIRRSAAKFMLFYRFECCVKHSVKCKNTPKTSCGKLQKIAEMLKIATKQ